MEDKLILELEITGEDVSVMSFASVKYARAMFASINKVYDVIKYEIDKDNCNILRVKANKKVS